MMTEIVIDGSQSQSSLSSQSSPFSFPLLLLIVTWQARCVLTAEMIHDKRFCFGSHEVTKSLLRMRVCVCTHKYIYMCDCVCLRVCVCACDLAYWCRCCIRPGGSKAVHMCSVDLAQVFLRLEAESRWRNGEAQVFSDDNTPLFRCALVFLRLYFWRDFNITVFFLLFCLFFFFRNNLTLGNSSTSWNTRVLDS